MNHLWIVIFIPILGILTGMQANRQKYLLERAKLQASLGDGSREVESLRNELDDVRRELADLQERMDFSERLMAQRADASRLPATPDGPTP